jgi:hypothetical protein
MLFNLTTSSTANDLRIHVDHTPNQDNMDGQQCGISYDSGDVYLSEEAEAAAGSSNGTVRDNVAKLVMHEVGHNMGLDDATSGDTIMRTHGSGSDCEDAMANHANYPSEGLTNDDANAMADCIFEHRNTYIPGEEPEEVTDWEGCEVWLAIVHWECDEGGCVPTGYTPIQYLGECDPPI